MQGEIATYVEPVELTLFTQKNLVDSKIPRPELHRNPSSLE